MCRRGSQHSIVNLRRNLEACDVGRVIDGTESDAEDVRRDGTSSDLQFIGVDFLSNPLPIRSRHEVNRLRINVDHNPIGPVMFPRRQQTHGVYKVPLAQEAPDILWMSHRYLDIQSRI